MWAHFLGRGFVNPIDDFGSHNPPSNPELLDKLGEEFQANGYDVTDDFINYAAPLVGEDWISVPLIGGRLRFAQLKPIFANQKLPSYVPQADRPKK